MGTVKPNPPNFNFEFPTLISDPALQNDVVFCGRVITRQTGRPGLEDPFMVRSKSFSKPKPVQAIDQDQRWGSFRSPATRYSGLPRSSSSSRRYSNGLFGVIKCPVQMELSDMKKRQSAMLPKLATGSDGGSENGGGGKSGWKWQLIRSLRRKGCQWLNALSASSFDF